MKLVISPSKLEKWRYHHLYPNSVTFQDLVDYLEGVKTYSIKATAGTAYHTLIEEGPEKFWDEKQNMYVVPFPEINRVHCFKSQEVLPVYKFRKSYPHMIHEKKNYYHLDVMGHEVIVPMRLDGLNGIVCHDHKYVIRNDVDVEGYMESFQWKIYLLSTGCKVFQYNIFHQQPEDEDQPDLPRDINWFHFYLYPYPHMKEDVHNGYAQFINFLVEHDLLHLVKSKF